MNLSHNVCPDDNVSKLNLKLGQLGPTFHGPVTLSFSI